MHQQPKRLVIKPLLPKTNSSISGSIEEYRIGGFICKIIDNDGTTILYEFWERHEKLAIRKCREWLDEYIENKQETQKESDVKSDVKTDKMG